MTPNNNTLLASHLQIINNALTNAAKLAKDGWVKTQFESAVVLDYLSSMEDPRFVAWKAWSACKKDDEDHRYVTWKRELVDFR